MLDHISIGVKDLERRKTFYDAVLGVLGYGCLSEDETALGYGIKKVRFYVLKSKKPVPADETSGLHFCFTAKTKQNVEAFYDAAMKQESLDNGKPGIREDYGPGYYAAFVKDPDSYRLEAFCNLQD